MSDDLRGYRYHGLDDCEPTPEQLARAQDLLREVDLPFRDDANLDEGVSWVGSMIASSELALGGADEGVRHAEDIDANEKRLIILAEKLKDQISITLHCLEDPAAQLLIDHHMGYAGNN